MPPPNPFSPILKAWQNWKGLRLPWRKRFLVGSDLQGNTYWEFRDMRAGPDATGRWRRIVQYPRSTHYSEVKVAPQWSQWLRHVREGPPSLEEQRADVARRERMKLLAAEADARWEAKPRVMDDPASHAATGPALASEPGRGEARPGVLEPGPEAPGAAKSSSATPVEDPWKRARGGPSEDWQPEAWNPSKSPKR
ncbi:hypothetical protein RB595_000648 [Gaeumannomyces hyphopodioides]